LSFRKALLLEAAGIVVEHLKEGLVILDSASEQIYFNPIAIELYGFASAAEALLCLPDMPKLFELTTLEGKILPLEDWPFRSILRGAVLRELELKIRRFNPGWTRVFRYSGSRVMCAGRDMAFLTICDVTERKRAERELERVSRLNIARSHVNQAIVRTHDRKILFRRVCQVLVEQGGFGMAWIGWRSARTEQLVPVAVYGEQGEYLTGLDVYTDERPQGQGPSGIAYRGGKPYICNDAFSDPVTMLWRPEFQRRGLFASAAFPIRRAARVRGVLSVYAKEVGFFRDKEIALLEEVADDLTFALDHFASEAARRYAEAATEQYARRLQATSHRLLTVQEAERRVLARELHDAVGQELTALSLNLTIIGGALPGETPDKVRERLEDSQELLEDTTRHLRDIMVELRPPGLDELGLLAALREHASHVGRRAELAINVTGVEPRPRLPPTEEIALFRIAQEALNNVVKHAQASECSISLRQNESAVVLRIIDNGAGFDTRRKPEMGGYGMGTTTMRERAEAIGAQLRLEATPGAGTRITIELSWPVADN
jgi:signal transduction histidine kinase